MNEKATLKWKKWFVPMMFVLFALGGLAHLGRSCSPQPVSPTAAEEGSAP
ncbi:hypothetical protein [Myxococcus sp. AS-1-15]|nr:hypothetical protein [Myxococcus sp. AS-1-15]MBZ4400402.1 hypothetical protein [Myxococcus sp. AS-1-15]